MGGRRARWPEDLFLHVFTNLTYFQLKYPTDQGTNNFCDKIMHISSINAQLLFEQLVHIVLVVIGSLA